MRRSLVPEASSKTSDEDGTGSLDREEFRVVMTEVLASDWTPRLDRASGRTYYVNLKTRATSWALLNDSDANAFVRDHFNRTLAAEAGW